MCKVLAIPRNRGVGSVSFSTDFGLAFLVWAFSFGVGNEFVLIMHVIIVIGMFKSLQNSLRLLSIRGELVSVRC